MNKRALSIGMVIWLSTAVPSPALAATSAGSDDVSAVLGSANETFRSDYECARREITSQLNPLIYCNGEVLTLVTSSGKKSENIVPAEYTLLKSVDHIALAAYVAVANHSDEALAPDVLERLQALQKHAIEARKALASGAMAAELRDRQYRIIDSTLDFIGQAQKDRSISRSKLKEFASGLSADLMRNADDGVAAQLALMNEIVSRWKSELSPEDWRRLHVILTAGHMPRERLVTWQFFSSLLNQDKEGDRIIIMEGMDDFDKGVELLGTHILDEKIALDFFGDRWRMHRDLLSNGARLYLRKHPPGK